MELAVHGFEAEKTYSNREVKSTGHACTGQHELREWNSKYETGESFASF